MVILNSGKHNIPRRVSLYNYSLEDVNIKESIVTLTKDAEQIVCKVNYRYRLNPKTIMKLHIEVGSNFLDRLILPKIRSKTRESSSVYEFVDIEASEIEKAIVSKLKSDVEFSEFIKTTSFKLKIEPYKN